MDKKEIQKWIKFLQDKNHDLPDLLKDEKYIMHWTGRLYLAKVLYSEYKEDKAAYYILRDLYVKNDIKHTSDVFENYEDYVKEKINFFKNLASLSHLVTKEAAQSVPYIDEALITMGQVEGDDLEKEELTKLRKYYVQKSLEE